MLPKSLSFRIAAGGGPCSPRNTVYVVASAAERAGIAAPGTASAATATHAINRCFIVLSPLSRTIRLCSLARCQRAGRGSVCPWADDGAYNRHWSGSGRTPSSALSIVRRHRRPVHVLEGAHEAAAQ